MRAPSERAFWTNSFRRGASSFSRETALGLVWVSHMSQMMMAVASGSHCSLVVFFAYPERDWSDRCQGSPVSAGVARRRSATAMRSESIL